MTQYMLFQVLLSKHFISERKKSFQRPVSKIGPDFGCLSYAYKIGGGGPTTPYSEKLQHLAQTSHFYVLIDVQKKLHVFTIL